MTPIFSLWQRVLWQVSLSIRIPATRAPKLLWKSSSQCYDYTAADFQCVSLRLRKELVVSEKKGFLSYSAIY